MYYEKEHRENATRQQHKFFLFCHCRTQGTNILDLERQTSVNPHSKKKKAHALEI